MFNFINLLQTSLLIGLFFAILSLLHHYYLIEKLFNLIAIFILVAFWLLLNGFEFLPLIMLIIYVGSIAVLFLFVVMIINPDYMDMRDDFFNVKYLWYLQDLRTWGINKTEEYSAVQEVKVTPVELKQLKALLSLNTTVQNKTKFRYLSMYFVWGFLFFIVYFCGFVGSWNIISCFYAFDKIIFVTTFVHDNLYFGFSDIYYIANLLYSRFYFEFLLMGFVLFVAMVGVIMFGARKSLIIKRQNLSEQFFRYR